MFGGGMIDVKTIDDRLYIDMYELTMHILQAAQDMADSDDKDAIAISQTLAMVSMTLSELAIYTLEKDEIDNVEEMLKRWSSKG